MMNNLIIKIEKSTRMVDLPKTTIGNDTENLQEKLIFKFTDNFVDGQARLEYKINGTKNYIVLTKENDTYAIPVQNVITKEGKIEMQLVITEGTDEENISVFKSNVFYLYCNKSINAVNEAPDGYELWIETANAKLNLMDEALTEVDNLNIDANKVDTTTTIEITKKDGTTKEVEILDGERGPQGEQGVQGVKGDNATINGVNTLTIVAGTNITLDQEGSTLTINSTGGGSGGTSDYTDLTNKPSINNVTLSGNKSLNDLGIQPAGNYALESEMPTKTSDLTNDSGFITGYIETDPTVPSHVKNITQANITSWNNKSNFSGNYNDLTNKPTIPVVPTNVSAFTNDVGYLTQHQDISGKVNTSQVKNTMSTTAGDVYDVRYINSILGNISTVLASLVTVGGGE